MSVKSWLKKNLVKQGSGEAAHIDLLGTDETQPKTPNNAGIQFTLIPRPWAINKIKSILNDAKLQPTEASFLAARQARHQLSLFWLTTPVDMVEVLYQEKLGSLHRKIMEHPILKASLCKDEKQWRKILIEHRNNNQDSSQMTNLSLALMLYRKPGTFRLKKAELILPKIILEDYIYYCDKSLRDKLKRPAGLLNPAKAKN